MLPQTVVVCGAGFLGSNIARIVANSPLNPERRVRLTSRNPKKVHDSLNGLVPKDRLLPPIALDVTKPETLTTAFEDANVIISLVGVMHGTPQQFEDIQWKGAENVAKAARRAGARLVHFSAIGADASSTIPYVRTKGLAENSVLNQCPDATILRPSLVFGPQDDFFNRFSRLSRFLPFLPVFGGGLSRFQPVFVEDLARAVEVITRNNSDINRLVAGNFIEAGGPEIFTYRELMELVLHYSHRRRLIISLPFQFGVAQGALLERLPKNLFTVTRGQIEQLKTDNIVNTFPMPKHVSFAKLVEQYSEPLVSLHDVLPTYL